MIDELINYDDLALALFARLQVYTPVRFALNGYNYPIDIFLTYLKKSLDDVLVTRLPDAFDVCLAVLESKFSEYRDMVGVLTDSEYEKQKAVYTADMQAFMRVMGCIRKGMS